MSQGGAKKGKFYRIGRALFAPRDALRGNGGSGCAKGRLPASTVLMGCKIEEGALQKGMGGGIKKGGMEDRQGKGSVSEKGKTRSSCQKGVVLKGRDMGEGTWEKKRNVPRKGGGEDRGGRRGKAELGRCVLSGTSTERSKVVAHFQHYAIHSRGGMPARMEGLSEKASNPVEGVKGET